MSKRTKKDEQKYDAELRREADIVREVILELRADKKELLKGQRMVLMSLIDTSEALIKALQTLNLYRNDVLGVIERSIARDDSCGEGCRKHKWTTENGWERTESA